MSSTTSNVSATPAVASSPWPQTAAASQDNAQDHSGGPFAALLDAAATAPDNTNTQPQPAAPRTSTAAANQLAAKFATRRNSGTTAQPRARRPTRRHPRLRRKTPIQRQLPSQVQTQQWIQARPRMRRPTKPARHPTILPGQPRPWSPTQRPTPLHRMRRQKPHQTTRTTAAVRPTPAPSWPRRLRPTSRHSPLRRPLSPIWSSLLRRRQPLRLRQTW